MSLFLASLAISLLLCSLLLRFPQRLLGRDDPAGLERKQQSRPIPTVGLLVPTLALLFFAQLDLWGGICLALMAVLGWWDDRCEPGMSWLQKLTGQLLILALFFVFSNSSPATGSPIHEQALLFLLAYLILTAWNIFDNFDGGMAWMALASLGSALLLLGRVDALPVSGPVLIPVLAAALLAFLPFNWPRARLYLGNAGSQATGLALLFLTLGIATTAGELFPLRETPPRAWLLLLVPHLLILIDLFQVVTGRLLRGARPWVGDRMHLAHLLQRRSCPDALVAPVLASAQILLTLASLYWFLP